MSLLQCQASGFVCYSMGAFVDEMYEMHTYVYCLALKRRLADHSWDATLLVNEQYKQYSLLTAECFGCITTGRLVWAGNQPQLSTSTCSPTLIA